MCKMNSKNVMDAICGENAAPLLQDLEALILKLVQRGGRLTAENALGMDVEAVEIYREALATIMSPK
jgi:hypothetical protein